MDELRLTKERTCRKWSQKQLAKMVGASTQLVCDWEKGRCHPRFEKIVHLEEIFELPIRDLFTVVHDNDSSNA